MDSYVKITFSKMEYIFLEGLFSTLNHSSVIRSLSHYKQGTLKLMTLYLYLACLSNVCSMFL